MKHNRIIKLVIYIFIISSNISCDDNETLGDNANGDVSIESIEKILKDVVTDWNLSQEDLSIRMKGYRQIYSTDEMLQYVPPKNSKISVAYQFKGTKLMSAAVVFPRTDKNIDVSSLIGGYTFLGLLDNSEVYANKFKNTVSTVKEYADKDSLYSAIGFAPIKSDILDNLSPYKCSTHEEYDLVPFGASVTGEITGTNKNVEVGIIYGESNALTEEDKKVSTTANGKFTLAIKGLIEGKTYYYCAYAMIDDIYYYGEVNSLIAGPMTYKIDNQTYKMVEVDGEHSFYVMQTEIPPSAVVNIANVNLTPLDKNGDNIVIKSEFRGFLNSLREATGLAFRIPTKAEWQYAAAGGHKSKAYTYSGSNNADLVAWHSGNSNSKSHGVALLEPNELGLYDMSGNFAEICNDTDDEYYIDGDYCGGNFLLKSSDCTITSSKPGESGNNKIAGTNYRHKNAFEGKYYTIRLVFTK